MGPVLLFIRHQLPIKKLLIQYKQEHGLTQKQLAKKLGVSDAYISQILNGRFNYTLKKLIQIGLRLGKIPYLDFVDEEEYLKRTKYNRPYLFPSDW